MGLGSIMSTGSLGGRGKNVIADGEGTTNVRSLASGKPLEGLSDVLKDFCVQLFHCHHTQLYRARKDFRNDNPPL